MSRTRDQILADISAARTRVLELERELDRASPAPDETDLLREEYVRYGRQMILPAIGLPGQRRLRRARLLVIGAGGLGCPAMLYLASAGVGHITLLDPDTVDLSNLHRQVLHSTSKAGLPKVESALEALRAINPFLVIDARQSAFNPAYVAGLETGDAVRRGDFDVVLDCCDNPSTRHFVNAYAVKHGIALVSGGAVRTDGVVGVYNLRTADSSETGPCYACMHPPPARDAPPLSEVDKALLGTGACADEGVLGVTCGIVGITMATETMRVLLGQATPTMHLMTFSALPLRTIKLRAKKASCPVCSRPDQINLSQFSYEEACVMPDKSDSDYDIASVSYESARDGLIVDTRSETEFGICHLPESQNVPFATLVRDPASVLSMVDDGQAMTLVCRRGNDSLIAAKVLRAKAKEEGKDITVMDLKGGWEAYAREHDAVIY